MCLPYLIFSDKLPKTHLLFDLALLILESKSKILKSKSVFDSGLMYNLADLKILKLIGGKNSQVTVCVQCCGGNSRFLYLELQKAWWECYVIACTHKPYFQCVEWCIRDAF